MNKFACFVFMVLCSAAPARAEKAIINDYFTSITGKNLPIVMDLPDDASRAGAEAYIKDVHDSFYKGSELLDAAKLTRAELESKLSEGFVLYAVLGKSRVLAAVKQPAFEYSRGKLTVDGETFSGDLRYYTLAANPYKKGAYCQVYAASSNAWLHGINNMNHGSASYHVYLASAPAAEGIFDENFTYAARGLTPADALEDISEFFTRCEHVHPDLLASLPELQYVDLKKRTVNTVLSKASNGLIPVRDLAYELYYAAAAFGDGHTSLQYRELSGRDLAKAAYPPFRFEYRNGRFFISGAADKALAGAEILSVNGKPFAEFAAPVLERCSGEILPFKVHRFAMSQQFWWAISGLFNGSNSFTLSYRRAQDAPITRKLAVTSAENFAKLDSGEQKKETTHLEYLDGGVAYFRYPAFIYSDEEKAAVDGIFADIRRTGAKKLIVDIRGNGGGNSNMGDHILSYLTDRPVRTFSKMRVKISDEVLADAKYREMLGEMGALRGMLTTSVSQEERQKKPENFYTGKAYLMADNGTFSSATDFATMFRDYGCGTIIGYETGGLPTCFGDVFTMRLPNSGIRFGVSYKLFYAARPRPGDDEHGLLPDIPLTDEKLAPFKAGDPGLAFALDYIGKDD